MQYLYHRVPKDMDGNILYPLNELKHINPGIYEESVKKYTGREFVMDQRVPTLDCMWNDVIHMSPVHPQEADNELKKYSEGITSGRFFKIDPNILNPDDTTIFLFKHNTEEEKFASLNWTEYDPNDLEQYSHFPERTAEYYKRVFAKGERPLLWVFVPHIMHRGHIDISNTEIIELE